MPIADSTASTATVASCAHSTGRQRRDGGPPVGKTSISTGTSGSVPAHDTAATHRTAAAPETWCWASHSAATATLTAGCDAAGQARQADQAMIDHGRGAFATGQLLRISLGGRRAQLVNASHPWPLRLSDGAVEERRPPASAPAPAGRISWCARHAGT